ncbi:hypothetical protein Fcan01_26975 [Folsomia candida]|uniref:Uncharacterized protein n=1 Tax=Folsomia candida TaxID=158441 RepID=A0A226CZ51_FOLCA|nr:hypothetical protein Fcan01_26975 [Folsomia candida]
MCVGRMNRRPQILVPDLPVREDHIFRQDEAVWTLATGRAQEIEVSLGVVVASSREGNQDLYRIHWPGFAWKDDYIVQKLLPPPGTMILIPTRWRKSPLNLLPPPTLAQRVYISALVPQDMRDLAPEPLRGQEYAGMQEDEGDRDLPDEHQYNVPRLPDVEVGVIPTPAEVRGELCHSVLARKVRDEAAVQILALRRGAGHQLPVDVDGALDLIVSEIKAQETRGLFVSEHLYWLWCERLMQGAVRLMYCPICNTGVTFGQRTSFNAHLNREHDLLATTHACGFPTCPYSSMFVEYLLSDDILPLLATMRPTKLPGGDNSFREDPSEPRDRYQQETSPSPSPAPCVGTCPDGRNRTRELARSSSSSSAPPPQEVDEAETDDDDSSGGEEDSDDDDPPPPHLLGLSLVHQQGEALAQQRRLALVQGLGMEPIVGTPRDGALARQTEEKTLPEVLRGGLHGLLLVEVPEEQLLGTWIKAGPSPRMLPLREHRNDPPCAINRSQDQSGPGETSDAGQLYVQKLSSGDGPRTYVNINELNFITRLSFITL